MLCCMNEESKLISGTDWPSAFVRFSCTSLVFVPFPAVAILIAMLSLQCVLHPPPAFPPGHTLSSSPPPTTGQTGSVSEFRARLPQWPLRVAYLPSKHVSTLSTPTTLHLASGIPLKRLSILVFIRLMQNRAKRTSAISLGFLTNLTYPKLGVG